MRNFGDWSAWSWDYTTAFWVFWIVQFAVWESYTGIRHQGEMLTDHLRPLMLNAPVTWFLFFGVWLWLGVHFLAPTLERSLIEMVRQL